MPSIEPMSVPPQTAVRADVNERTRSRLRRVLALRKVRLSLLGLVLLGALLGAAGWWLPNALLKRAKDHVRHARRPEATRVLRWYVLLRPGDSEARLNLANLLVRGGNANAAVRQLEYISDADSHAPSARLQAAEILYLRLRRPGQAERQLRRILEIDSTNVDAKFGLFQILFTQDRRRPELWQWLDEAFLSGDFGAQLRALSMRFWLMYAEFPIQDSFPILDRAVAQDPGDVGSKIGLAACHFRMNQPETAIALLRDCVGKGPDDSDARTKLVEHFLETGDIAKAGTYLEGWDGADNDVEYWTLKGRYLQATWKFHEAIDCFERALALRPDRWTTRSQLSRCLDEIGLRDRAAAERRESDRMGKELLDTRVRALLTEVIPEFRRYPEGAHKLADLLEAVGHKKDAQRWRELAVVMTTGGIRLGGSDEEQSLKEAEND
jgi:tetratricopeptide (TPR) repeat protein